MNYHEYRESPAHFLDFAGAVRHVDGSTVVPAAEARQLLADHLRQHSTCYCVACKRYDVADPSGRRKHAGCGGLLLDAEQVLARTLPL